ncbi:unnamed protein product, partial [Amoebophrya sp. A25]
SPARGQVSPDYPEIRDGVADLCGNAEAAFRCEGGLDLDFPPDLLTGAAFND